MTVRRKERWAMARWRDGYGGYDLSYPGTTYGSGGGNHADDADLHEQWRWTAFLARQGVRQKVRQFKVSGFDPADEDVQDGVYWAADDIMERLVEPGLDDWGRRVRATEIAWARLGYVRPGAVRLRRRRRQRR